MTRIKFNNNDALIFDVTNYNRNTNFEGGVVNSYINLGLAAGETVMNRLQTLGLAGDITTIELIKDNGDIVLDLINIIGKIVSIDESLNDDNLWINMAIRIGNA